MDLKILFGVVFWCLVVLYTFCSLAQLYTCLAVNVLTRVSFWPPLPPKLCRTIFYQIESNADWFWPPKFAWGHFRPPKLCIFILSYSYLGQYRVANLSGILLYNELLGQSQDKRAPVRKKLTPLRKQIFLPKFLQEDVWQSRLKGSDKWPLMGWTWASADTAEQNFNAKGKEGQFSPKLYIKNFEIFPTLESFPPEILRSTLRKLKF